MQRKPFNRCHCGKPLHYTCDLTYKWVNKMILEFGEYMEVTSLVTKKKYKVQRHYIALHGLKHDDLHTKGFQEI